MPFGGFAPLPIRLGGSATEGWAPEAHARAVADRTAIVRTCPLFKITFTTLNPGDPTIHAMHAMHGVGSTYFPDQAFASGVGIVDFRWSARRWSDDFEISYPFHFRHGRVTLHGSTAGFGTVTLNVWGVKVRLFDAAGAAIDGKATLSIF